MTMRIFLENLEKIRKLNKWDMKDMYERLDFGKSTFHNWKSGKSKPSLNMLEQIARNANVTLSDLLREGFVPEKTYVEQVTELLNEAQRIYIRLSQFHTECSELLIVLKGSKYYEQNGIDLTSAGISQHL